MILKQFHVYRAPYAAPTPPRGPDGIPRRPRVRGEFLTTWAAAARRIEPAPGRLRARFERPFEATLQGAQNWANLLLIFISCLRACRDRPVVCVVSTRAGPVASAPQRRRRARLLSRGTPAPTKVVPGRNVQKKATFVAAPAHEHALIDAPMAFPTPQPMRATEDGPSGPVPTLF